MPDLWERQPEESDKSFKAFQLYRDLGPQRTIPQVREALGRKSGYDRQLEKWSSRYNWGERAGAYDAHVDDKVRDANESELVEMLTRHAKLAQRLQVVAEKVIADIEAKMDGGDGAVEMSPAEVTRWLDLGVRLERQAKGAPDQVVKQQHDFGGDPLAAKLAQDPVLRAQALALLEATAGTHGSTD